jgi:hypothetical protein
MPKLTKRSKKQVKYIVIDSREIINHIVGKINSGEIKLKGWEIPITERRGR